LAKDIREGIVIKLPGLAIQPNKEWLNRTWWFLVTLGEAYFGLDDCENAEVWLTKAAGLPKVPDWEQETTARQLAALLRIKQNLEGRGGPKVKEGARDVLLKFLGKNAAATESVVRGKVGLALSGGGFRASLYHVGVFAKLAELDLLRHVEYLSCVSGGSIVGAHFYLEVRNLLQQKSDAAITREDYIDIVRRLEKDFYEGVKTNIRNGEPNGQGSSPDADGYDPYSYGRSRYGVGSGGNGDGPGAEPRQPSGPGAYNQDNTAPLGPGDSKGSLVTDDGLTRTYVIHTPANYDPKKSYPLVLATAKPASASLVMYRLLVTLVPTGPTRTTGKLAKPKPPYLALPSSSIVSSNPTVKIYAPQENFGIFYLS
jgi:hypothetical protein